ncbi:hypothetical protein Trydic_g13603 [Trypoxylus dichotomus]
MSSSSLTQQKRKHKTLSLNIKAEILRRIDKGEKLVDLAKYYGLGRATIYDVKQNREKIEAFMRNTEFNFCARRTLKYGEFPQVEEALFQWITHQRDKNVPLSGDLIQEKAKFYYKQIMKKDDFKASNGWLDKFKKRYGIRLSNCTREEKKPSVKEVNLPSHIKQLHEKINELRLLPDQIYNVEISNLFWKSLPESLVRENVFSDGMTIMPCSNASGTHKLDILVIGEHKTPRIIRNLNLPINYITKSHKGMTQEIFTEWFYDHFAPATTEFLIKQMLPRIALLIVHNELGFPHEDLIHSKEGFYQILLVPQEEANMVQIVKNYYRKNLLVNMITQKLTLNKYICEMNMENAMVNLGYAWQSISPPTLITSWKKLWPMNSLITTNIENEVSKQIDTLNEDLQQAISHLSQKESSEIPSTEINNWLNSDTGGDLKIMKNDPEDDTGIMINVSNVEENHSAKSETLVEYEEAISSFNTCIKWAEENAVDLEDILLLKRLQEKAVKESLSARKESAIETYFMEGSVKTEFLAE